ncbi:MAG: peptidase domain-containing ABC transporter [Paramuribaculum sp.]|nr:peptidase domain-containing ABC transporter [Paramuribaculum sp.]
MRFPFVRQKDLMQCGAACLTMICRYWGSNISLNSVSSLCQTTKEGVSMRAISDTANELGLDNATYKLSVDKLAENMVPCILHWNQNHFVVLFGVNKSRTKFRIADPSKGIIKVSRGELEKHWSVHSEGGEGKGVVMLFHPRDEFKKQYEQEVSTARSIRFVMRYVYEYRRYFAHILLGLSLGCLLQLILPFLTQWIVDIGISHRDIKLIWMILAGELMIVVGATATDFFRRWIILHISMRVNITLLSDFFIKLLKLPMSFFDTKKVGDLMQRMSDHYRIQSFLTGQVLNVFLSAVSFVVFGMVLFFYSRLIFTVFIIGSMLYVAWALSFLRRRKVLDNETFEVQSVIQGKTFQFLTSMQEIKLQRCEQRRRWEWEDAQVDLFGVQMKLLKLQQTQEAGTLFINELKNILITVLAATSVINGSLTLGAMLAIQYIIGQLNSPVAQFMSVLYSFQDVKISLERINDIHKSRDEESQQQLAQRFDDDDRSISIRDVDFRYDRYAARNTIDNVSMHIPSGKVTAIVGMSGSGKTTLIKLMLGYYNLLRGEITVGGRSLETLSPSWWRSQCGVVMQDGAIFAESIERNIAVDDGEIDYARLYEAAKVANIHDYVLGLPLKYGTVIGAEGKGLSQGQKQRILIARAVYKNPDFIFLDEATNALDANNEKVIVENLTRFYAGRTVVVVAHRLSTVKFADQIIVLDSGRIVEQGTHKTLTALRGHYYNLVKNQLELG